MKELGLTELIPAMCQFDYTMSEAGGVTNFVREYTLASGGSYCDCGYKKKFKKFEIIIVFLQHIEYTKNNRTQHASQRCGPRWVF